MNLHVTKQNQNGESFGIIGIELYGISYTNSANLQTFQVCFKSFCFGESSDIEYFLVLLSLVTCLCITKSFEALQVMKYVIIFIYIVQKYILENSFDILSTVCILQSMYKRSKLSNDYGDLHVYLNLFQGSTNPLFRKII